MFILVVLIKAIPYAIGGLFLPYLYLHEKGKFGNWLREFFD